MKKEDNKAENPKTTEEAERTPFDSVAYNELYVIKHKPGFFILVSRPTKEGWIGIRRWEEIIDPNRPSASAQAKDCTSLLSFVFYTRDGQTLNLNDVFNNLYKYEETLPGDTGIEELDFNDDKTVELLQNIAVPNYNEEEFKAHNLLKVVKMYTWAKEAIVRITELARQ